MIPKIIHYCWFGKGPIPKSQKDCIKSWQKIMPDYKIMRWDETNFDVEKYSFSKYAHKVKRYAMVSDLCRFNVLYEYGGIYLDTDVEVFQRFDKFLNADFFSAIELYADFYTDEIQQMLNEDGSPKTQGVDIPKLEMLTSIIGSAPKNVLVGELRDFYNAVEANEEFALNSREYINHDRMVARFATKYGFKYKDELQHLDHNMVIYPTGVFGYAWSPNENFEVSYHYNAMSWESNISVYKKKRIILDKYHLLAVYERYKKIKSWIRKLLKL